MSCVKNVLGFRWERHDWTRRVTHTEHESFRGTDMWSRTVPVDQVICHAQYVCRACGAVRDEGDCNCDSAQAEKCAVRLAWIAERPRADADA